MVEALENGLSALFPPADARFDASFGLFASPELLASGHVVAQVGGLLGSLAADTYGGVDAVAWARDAYNSRRLRLNQFLSDLVSDHVGMLDCVCAILELAFGVLGGLKLFALEAWSRGRFCFLNSCSEILARHPMHCVLDVPGPHGRRGRLWLGGAQASAHAEHLEDNSISMVLPASRKPFCEESLQVAVLPYVDGTGLANGSEDLDAFLKVCDAILERLDQGLSTIVCCKNGAHRSATEACVLIMRWTGWDTTRAANYLFSLRNIVDLASVPRPNAQTRRPKKPEHFLRESEAKIHSGAWGRVGCDIWSPVMFRKKAQELGFACVAKAKSMPKPRSRREPVPGGWSSYEVVSEQEGHKSDLNSSSLESESSGRESKRAINGHPPQTPSCWRTQALTT